MKTKNMNIILIITILAVSLFAADWPQFKRTPDRQGCNLAESITLPSKLCAWIDFGSPVLSSPVIVTGKAYCMAENGLLACVDLATNTVVWHQNLGGQSNECTPAVGNGKVYVGSTVGKFYVLDAATGTVLKQYDAGAMIFASPLLLSTGVYFGSYNGIFHALDLSGNLKWTDTAQYNIKHGAACGKGQIIYVDGNANMVWLEDSVTYGRKVRVVHRGPADNSDLTGWINTPMIWRDSVFAAFSQAEMVSTDQDLLQYNMVTGAFIKNKGFGGIGGGGASIFATPSVDTSNGNLFVSTANGGFFGAGWGTIAVYSAYPTGLFAVNSSPAVIGNCVIFGSEVSLDTGGCAIHFLAKTSGNTYGGTQLWSYRPASFKPVSSSPAVADGRVVVGSLDGCLYGFWNGTQVTAPIKVDSTGTGIAKGNVAAPGQWTLSVFPNPASGSRVMIEISGMAPGVVIAVHDISGAVVAELKAGRAGKFPWDLKDLHGRVVAAGSYFATVRGPNGKSMRSFNLQVLK